MQQSGQRIDLHAVGDIPRTYNGLLSVKRLTMDFHRNRMDKQDAAGRFDFPFVVIAVPKIIGRHFLEVSIEGISDGRAIGKKGDESSDAVIAVLSQNQRTEPRRHPKQFNGKHLVCAFNIKMARPCML